MRHQLSELARREARRRTLLAPADASHGQIENRAQLRHAEWPHQHCAVVSFDAREPGPASVHAGPGGQVVECGERYRPVEDRDVELGATVVLRPVDAKVLIRAGGKTGKGRAGGQGVVEPNLSAVGPSLQVHDAHMRAAAREEGAKPPQRLRDFGIASQVAVEGEVDSALTERDRSPGGDRVTLPVPDAQQRDAAACSG